MAGYILAIDQGTTSSRAIVFDADQKVRGIGQEEFPQHYPHSGWVEHEPEDIWRTTVSSCRAAIERAGIEARDIAAIGIANQRETTVIWERRSGRPIHRAIVWQDRRTAETCARLRREGIEQTVTERTGLLLDSYFSGTKAAWIIDQTPGAREQAARGELLFGTIDTYLIWRLTGGRRHVTDATNASRTLLFNIASHEWDEELLAIIGVSGAMLPEVLDCRAPFGTTDADVLGAALPIFGVAGDQQAATIGQACFTPGMMKSTYGTGCFAVLNTGSERVASANRLLTTIAYRLEGRTTYALEGSIFVAGAAVQWLRDGLGLIAQSSQAGELAERADPGQDVYLVPAFVGLGAPHWDADARGALFGLSRNTGPAEFARAALESVCYQTFDLLEAMRADWSGASAQTVLRVDGGMVGSDWTMQCLADILAAPIDRPSILETTALGAAWLAGSHAGIWPDADGFAENWALERRFDPTMDAKLRDRKLAGWKSAVRRTLSAHS